jgi:hypothetical protein
MHTIQNIKYPADVTATYHPRPLSVTIHSVTFRDRTYAIHEVSYAYATRKGWTRFHIFWAAGQGITFKLVLDTESLAWTIQEIHTHESDSLALQHQDEFDPAH